MSEIRNLHPDPRCLKIRNMWRSTSTIIGEKRRYALADGAPTGSVFAWAPLTNDQLAGNVLYARITAAQDVLDKLSVEGAPVVAKQGSGSPRAARPWRIAPSPSPTAHTPSARSASTR